MVCSKYRSSFPAMYDVKRLIKTYYVYKRFLDAFLGLLLVSLCQTESSYNRGTSPSLLLLSKTQQPFQGIFRF